MFCEGGGGAGVDTIGREGAGGGGGGAGVDTIGREGAGGGGGTGAGR